MRSGAPLLSALGALALVAGCGTLNDEAPSSPELPTAEMGPFRALQNRELKGAAPLVLDDSRAQYSDPAALADGPAVVLFAVSGGKIVRTRALDGRTFYGIGQPGKSPLAVLAPDQPWEGAELSGPCAYRQGEDVLLFYAGAGGIGVARSRAGDLPFVKDAGPVLPGPVRGPSVFVLPSGELRMMFTTPEGLEEARSTDGGASWTRIPGVGLRASGAAGAFDAVAVADPVVATRVTAAGRLHVRVLFTGTSESGATAIGFAARYGEDGPLARNPQPAFASGSQPAYAPPLLYFTSRARAGYLAVGAALEPLDGALDAPGAYPPSP